MLFYLFPHSENPEASELLTGHQDNQSEIQNSGLVRFREFDQGCNNCKVYFDPEFRKQFYSRCSKIISHQFLLNRLCIHLHSGSRLVIDRFYFDCSN